MQLTYTNYISYLNTIIRNRAKLADIKRNKPHLYQQARLSYISSQVPKIRQLRAFLLQYPNEYRLFQWAWWFGADYVYHPSLLSKPQNYTPFFSWVDISKERSLLSKVPQINS